MFSASELPEVLNRQSWIRSVFVSQRSWTLWRSGWKRSSAKCPTSKYEREGLSVTLKVCCHYADLVSTFHTLLHLFLFSLQLLSFLFYFSSWYAWKRSLQMSWVCVSLQCSVSLCSINRCGTPPPPLIFFLRESACISCLHESHATSSFLSLSFQLQDYIFLCWANEAILSSDFNSLS